MCRRKIERAAKKSKNAFIFNVSIQAIYDLLFEILAILVYSLEHLSPQYKVTSLPEVSENFAKFSHYSYGLLYHFRT